MYPKKLLLLSVISLMTLNINAVINLIVNTTKGKVQGKISKTVLNQKPYLSFQGIPYAKPPINELRFRAPVEAEPWTNVKKTIQDGSNCTQLSEVGKIVGSEDCLYINCFVPLQNSRREKNLKAVIFYIYGGKFNRGSSRQELYGPDFLIEADVIIVTFNYRLSVFGFLSLDHPEALGNAGLKDQSFALRWVKENIKKFGGDPNRITIFGHSAGAASVDFQVLSKLSKGLFQQSISMSGSPYCHWSLSRKEDAISSAFKLGKSINNNNDVKNVKELLEMFKNASAEVLVSAAFGIKSATPPFLPVVEDPNIESEDPKFLTECYDKKYFYGHYNKGPHMVGFATEESIFDSKDINDFLLDQKKAVSRVTSSKPDTPIASKIQNLLNKSVNKLYRRLTKQKSKSLAFRSMFNFIGAVDHKQRKMSKNNNFPIYYYAFTHDAKNASLHYIKRNITELKGAGHADESPYIFYTSLTEMPLRPNPEYVRVRSQMIELFTNFAKYGNPTPVNRSKMLADVNWLDSRKTGSYLLIGKKLKFKTKRPCMRGLSQYQFLIKSVAPIQSDCRKSTVSNNRLTNSFLSSFFDKIKKG